LADAAKRIGVAAEKLAVIYNAVDFWEKLPVYQEPPRPVLVFSGRLVPWKGLAMILKVVAKLKSRWPGLRLEVLGDGPERASLEELAKNLGLESNVNWRGQVSEAATHQVFARSTLFVLNTNYEGLPFSVLNAMQVGVPVLTTPVGGNPEVVEHGVSGWLAPFNNEAAWQAALEQLLGDSSLRAKLAQGGRQTLAKFQWQRMVDQTLAVIESL